MDVIVSNASVQPIYEQIYSQIKAQILSGALREGELLPSIRALAKDLRISVITTKRAYDELEAEGFIYTLPGKGSFVAPKNTELLREENLRRIAEGLERGIDDLTVVILDRPRHQEIIDECRSAGARIKLITDGDVSPAVDAGIEGSGVHVLMGIGGAPEGVLAAAALKCLGGDMQARLIPYTDEERKRCWEMGIDDINRVMTLDDLVKGDDCIFSATAITDTPMMRGVQYFGGGARTMSVVMRYKSGTIRFIDTFHRFDKKAKWSIHL